MQLEIMATQGFISSLCLLILVTSMVHIEARGGNAIKQRDLNEVAKTKAKPKKPSPRQPDGDLPATTTWAILVAGSNRYRNYRHQADVCHAYQVLKKGGLKDENIIVFMYDDIANNEYNPKRGIIINRPGGEDVYAGVPKDYTGEYTTAQNFYNVLLGNGTAVKGGSGKVVNSKPDDRIFIYYSDHGGPGVLTMPNPPFVIAKDFIEVLKEKHASGNYKEMVIYVEACEAGSIFEGLLPQNMNIYVTTASNADESSYATYCDTQEYQTCLGDLYSVAWMEQSDSINRKTKKLKDQYLAVRERTSQNHTYEEGSHVMEYGDEIISEEMIYLFQGYDPTASTKLVKSNDQPIAYKEVVNSQDASLLFLWNKYKASKDGSMEKTSYLKQLTDEIKHRNHLDGSIKLIGHLLFGPAKHNSIVNSVREAGSPLVDDWDCYKSMIRLFETHCGSLSRYGLKHARAFANICNNGVSHAAMEEATVTACSGHDLGKWNPLEIGYTA